jgi:hypothetical protein
VSVLQWKNETHLLFAVSVQKSYLNHSDRLALFNWINKVPTSHPFTWRQKQIQLQKCHVLYNTRKWTRSKNWLILSVVIWVTMLSCLAGNYHYFGGTCCLHLHFCPENGDTRILWNTVNTYRTTRHNPEDHNLNFHSNFISHTRVWYRQNYAWCLHVQWNPQSALCDPTSKRAYTVSSTEPTFKATSSLSSPNQLYQDA